MIPKALYNCFRDTFYLVKCTSSCCLVILAFDLWSWDAIFLCCTNINYFHLGCCCYIYIWVGEKPACWWVEIAIKWVCVQMFLPVRSSHIMTLSIRTNHHSYLKYDTSAYHMYWKLCKVKKFNIYENPKLYLCTTLIFKAVTLLTNAASLLMISSGKSTTTYPCATSAECVTVGLITGDWVLVAEIGATTVGSTAVEVVTVGRDCRQGW